MPIALISTPESMADTGAGAEGWASGSQAWNGTSAAFRPKPQRNSASANSSGRSGPAAAWLAMWAMFRVPVTA